MELFDKGYNQGCKQVIARVSKWLDEDTIGQLEEEFLLGDK